MATSFLARGLISGRRDWKSCGSTSSSKRCASIEHRIYCVLHRSGPDLYVVQGNRPEPECPDPFSGGDHPGSCLFRNDCWNHGNLRCVRHLCLFPLSSDCKLEHFRRASAFKSGVVAGSGRCNLISARGATGRANPIALLANPRCLCSVINSLGISGWESSIHGIKDDLLPIRAKRSARVEFTF